MIVHLKCLPPFLEHSRHVINYDSLPFPSKDLHQMSSVIPLPCWVYPDSLHQGPSQVEEGDHAQGFLQWLVNSQLAEFG